MVRAVWETAYAKAQSRNDDGEFREMFASGDRAGAQGPCHGLWKVG